MNKQKFIKKLDNFWYYYKVHVLVGIFIVVVVLYIVLTSGQTKDAALNVVIVGNAMNDKQKVTLQQSATKDILGKNVDSIINLNFWTAGDGLTSGKHGGLQEKFIAMVSAKDIDVVIMDLKAFRLYAKQDTFLRLNSLRSGIPKDAKPLKIREKNDHYQHAYGIKIDGNPRLKQADYDTKNKVLAVVGNTKRPKRASDFVKWIVQK